MAWHDSHVILCSWELDAGCWRLWVTEDPSVAGEGGDYDEAEQALQRAIMDAAPDLDTVHPSVLEFDRALPASTDASRYATPEIYAISGDEPFDGMTNRAEHWEYVSTLYENGVCPDCRAARGPRNEMPLKLKYSSAADAAFLWSFGKPGPKVFSDRFLALLTPAERELIHVRPVQFDKKPRGRTFFEISATPTIPFVSIRGMDARGEECPQCGHGSFRVFDPWLNDSPPFLDRFICRADLPGSLPGFFVVGDKHDWSLCMTAERLRRQRGGKGNVGLASSRLGVVDAEHADRDPRLALRMLKERCPSCCKWPDAYAISGKPRRGFFGDDLFEFSRRNWTWIRDAQRSGHLVVTRETEPLEMIVELPQDRKHMPTALFSYRCPECWRLGYVLRTPKEYVFQPG